MGKLGTAKSTESTQKMSLKIQKFIAERIKTFDPTDFETRSRGELSSLEIKESVKEMKAISEALKPLDAELEKLIDLTADHATLPELAAHLEKHPPSALVIAKLVWAARDQGVSQLQSAKAAGKNSEERDFVRTKWKEREDLDQSKASFAREYASIVHRMFKLKVTARTIETRWLKGL